MTAPHAVTAIYQDATRTSRRQHLPRPPQLHKGDPQTKKETPMRCAILALAAGFLMIAGSSASYAGGKSAHAKGSKCGNGKCASSHHGNGLMRNSLGNHGCNSHRAGWGHGGYGCHGCGSCGFWGGQPIGCHGCGHHSPFGLFGPKCHLIGPGGPYMGPSGPPAPTYGYPYYTIRGPRDFLMDNPPTIGR